jgi:hypothetical protein
MKRILNQLYLQVIVVGVKMSVGMGIILVRKMSIDSLSNYDKKQR